MTAPTQELDARQLPEPQRPAAVLGQLARLETGQELVLVTPHDPRPLLRRLLAELPDRLDWGPLRRGPELWRWQFAARPPEPRTVAGYLVWDHRRMETLLHQGTTAAAAGQWREAGPRLEEYGVALLRHADIEDDILFPVYEKLGGGLADSPTAMMRGEHTQVRLAVHDLLAAARRTDAPGVLAALGRLQAVVVEHHVKEEEILFPSLDDALEPPARRALVEQLLLA
ncbi:MAG: hemerythrin domain-containing protein [Planctomycetes bacterium]|nr:hemerythrin domain-containing protein [Planctomycetota bacterium]MCL4731609.1 hemerythrin domain-containing protein [Planctomycetota bacterium]